MVDQRWIMEITINGGSKVDHGDHHQWCIKGGSWRSPSMVDQRWIMEITINGGSKVEHGDHHQFDLHVLNQYHSIPTSGHIVGPIS